MDLIIVPLIVGFAIPVAFAIGMAVYVIYRQCIARPI